MKYLSIGIGLFVWCVVGSQEIQSQTLVSSNSAAIGKKQSSVASPWSSVVEPDFPFFSSVLDARKLGKGWPTENLTPRGIILNLGNDCWACFDVDLLRVSAIWQGKGITPTGMAQGSYHVQGAKAPEGQGKLPQIVGTPWIANGLYPGWQAGEKISREDPREQGRDTNEIGRGPLPADLGKFKAARLLAHGVCLEYEVNGTSIRERIESRFEGGKARVQRTFELGSRKQTLTLLLGNRPAGVAGDLMVLITSNQKKPPAVAELVQISDLWSVRVPPSKKVVNFSVVIGFGLDPVRWQKTEEELPPKRWTEAVTTAGELSGKDEAFVVDNIPLPTANPWKRNVRFSDVTFLKNGQAAAVTFDGDVWLISGLKNNLERVTWQRFASGLHEPLGICSRDEQIFVFDRNGIWKLRDTDNNGEADVHELFSNAFTQTAETREYANGIRVAPDGSFVIAKGGQQGTSLGKDNGTVLRVSPDGTSVAVLGWGLRQPFIGVDPKTGTVTASDQQGHYTPATPLHFIGGRQYYGFLTGIEPKEKYPARIAEPLTWIPHSINPSGAGQAWMRNAKMGPLNDSLIHIGYYRPELFLVLLNDRTPRRQAVVVSLTRDFVFPPFAGAMNPGDGNFYVAGFQIWGTQAKEVSGLARLRYSGAPSTLPREIVPMQQGMLLRFDHPLDASSATNSANFSGERWNYKRTAEYGSPHFKMDGSKGQDVMFPSSVYLSENRKTVFVGIPEMGPAMQMRFGWSLRMQNGRSSQHNAYFTPAELSGFDPMAEGFQPLVVDLTMKSSAVIATATPISVEEGKRVVELVGCVACHSIDGSVLGKVGPTWKGLFGSERSLTAGKKVLADETYLRESILNPSTKVVLGFDKADTGMPSYEGVVTDAQLDSVLLYIKSLK